MALFTELEAKYFYSSGPCVGPVGSFRDWLNAQSNSPFSEGTPRFDELRSHSHREVERLLVLAASHYRRAHDALSAIGSAWALVTLYYGGFFSSKALLGALGAWKIGGNRVLEVSHSAAGSQRFQISTRTTSYSGSHEKFWDFYFAHASTLVPSALPGENFALQSISSDVTWLTDRRNDVNYDSSKAIDLGAAFRQTFTSTNFPASLPGSVSTMFRFCESSLLVANRVAKAIGINSDALSTITAATSRSGRVRELVIRERMPALGRKAKRRVVCG